MFIIYKTDNQHSSQSRDVIGLSESEEGVLSIINQKIEKEVEEDLTSDDIFNLANISQTQNYTGEGEFMFEEVLLDELI